MHGILSAHEGRVEMLRAIFGGGESAPEVATIAPRPMTPQLFDALFP